MKQIIINVSDETAQEMQKNLEDSLSALGLLRLAAQGGTTYESFIKLSELTAYEEAKEKTKRISNEIAEYKKKQHQPDRLFLESLQSHEPFCCGVC